jgi:hypothetical protein
MHDVGKIGINLDEGSRYVVLCVNTVDSVSFNKNSCDGNLALKELYFK